MVQKRSKEKRREEKRDAGSRGYMMWDEEMEKGIFKGKGKTRDK